MYSWWKVAGNSRNLWACAICVQNNCVPVNKRSKSWAWWSLWVPSNSGADRCEKRDTTGTEIKAPIAWSELQGKADHMFTPYYANVCILCKYMQNIFQEAQTITRKKGPDVRQLRSADFEQPRVPRLASPGLQCTGVALKLTAITATPFPGFGDSQSRQQCQRGILWNLSLTSSKAVPIYNIQEKGVYVLFSLKIKNKNKKYGLFFTFPSKYLHFAAPWNMSAMDRSV